MPQLITGRKHSLGMIYGAIQAQAAMLSFNDIYRILAIATITMVPSSLLMHGAKSSGAIVDPHARVATVSGGAKVKEVAAAAAAHGLVAALGNWGAVGTAGLILGGRYGPLNGLYGLAADNLLGAEVVLADGRRVTIGPKEEPKLFWAIRGGGGNFGVVTSLRVQLHKRRHMLAGSIVYPWTEAEPVLRRYATFAAIMPDELGVLVNMASGRDGQPSR